MNGADIVRSMATMHDRSNGLGGGFAGYGIYPQYKDYYAFHVFYEDNEAKKTCEAFLERHFEIINLSKIPVRKTPAITDAPLIWRYFVQPLPTKLADSQLDEKEFVVKCVIRINVTIDGAYVFSSGKNMGVFKAVGFPEDVGAFYRLGGDEGYCWTAQYAGLVGRRASVCAAGSIGGAQWRDLLLRCQPSVHRDVWLSMHAADGYRSYHLYH